MNGASNVNHLPVVPTTAPTVTKKAFLAPLPGALVHLRTVSADHDVVRHAVRPRAAEGVYPDPYPKLRPTSDTVVPPVFGEFTM
jgi:hypothetical protein